MKWCELKWVVALGGLAMSLAACSSCEEPPLHAQALYEIVGSDVDGISGLTFDGEQLWGVGERDHRLVGLAPVPPFEVRGTLEVEAVPAGADIESIAFLGDERFALGIEGQESDRASDPILLVKRDGGRMRLEKTLTVNYGAWGLTAQRNLGLEGMCSCAGGLYVASEQVGEIDDTSSDSPLARFAPVARYDLRSATWTHARLMLTSETGKISALLCEERADSVLFYAVERHYDVVRVLSFVWRHEARPAASGNHPAEQAAKVRLKNIVPNILLDLGGTLPAKTNLEGLARLDANAIVLIGDNQSRVVTGPTQVMVLKRDANGTFEVRPREP